MILTLSAMIMAGRVFLILYMTCINEKLYKLQIIQMVKYINYKLYKCQNINIFCIYLVVIGIRLY